MQRRTFVQLFGGALAAHPLRAFALAGGAHLDRIGLELYSVRAAMRRDPERTLAAVRAIGYTDVELLWSFGNFGRTPTQVRDTLRTLGLRAPSAHIAPELLLGDWRRALDDATLIGHELLIVPSLPDETLHSLDAWKRWADRFNSAGTLARASGVRLALHNEPDHVKPVDGVVPYDLFLERTDPAIVWLQLDVGNMTVGGGDPFAYLAKHRARYVSFHLKDVVADRSHDTDLGAGVFDLRRFLGQVTDIGTKPCYVEQESPADELVAAKHNWEYVKALEF
ncbi:MAG: sugar phosphate isomerase/epimerase [Gemmatimonadetes bacterium]|nr:sugar phosphate isomerase/epimerase [Gemmatimonadota bacterium]MBI3568848.1 sugar phosphate isomerase/epimerase [Gemmatimonadota bacterium]